MKKKELKKIEARALIGELDSIAVVLMIAASSSGYDGLAGEPVFEEGQHSAPVTYDTISAEKAEIIAANLDNLADRIAAINERLRMLLKVEAEVHTIGEGDNAITYRKID